MKAEEQINQAIAKACGKTYHKPTEDEIKSGSYYQYAPNYYRSLDAMHEAEKVLFAKHGKRKHDSFRDYLEKVTMKDWQDEKHYSPFTTCATAAQRAEAFLKTLGLWNE